MTTKNPKQDLADYLIRQVAADTGIAPGDIAEAIENAVFHLAESEQAHRLAVALQPKKPVGVLTIRLPKAEGLALSLGKDVGIIVQIDGEGLGAPAIVTAVSKDPEHDDVVRVTFAQMAPQPANPIDPLGLKTADHDH